MFAVTESKKSILDGPGEAEGSRDEMMAVSHRKKKQQIRGKVSDDTGRGEETHWVFLGWVGKSGKREEKRDETKQNERWRLSYARSRLTARVIFIPYTIEYSNMICIYDSIL